MLLPKGEGHPTIPPQTDSNPSRDRILGVLHVAKRANRRNNDPRTSMKAMKATVKICEVTKVLPSSFFLGARMSQVYCMPRCLYIYIHIFIYVSNTYIYTYI